jgi:GWxTD domain-containing protein
MRSAGRYCGVPGIRRIVVPLRALCLFLCVPGLAVLCARPVHALTRGERADSLYRHATTRLATNNVDQRRAALRELEQATIWAPENTEIELLLARTYYQCGFLKSARRRYESLAARAPNDPDARYGIGQVWRRDWLKYLDQLSLQRAIDNLRVSARARPQQCDTWLLLVPLLVERDSLDAALAAAIRAREADPKRPEPLLALAYTEYHEGKVAQAESAFVAALPRLNRNVREVFETIAPIASEQDTAALRQLAPVDQREFLRRFWKEHDPDPVSPENEAQLEYWSRAAHAFFLFYDTKRREWDERGEVYVRYGPPEIVAYNPVGTVDSYSFSTGPMYPVNVLVWDYPSLGMHVVLHDRLLSERYMLPVSMEADMDPRPDPAVLARRSDALASRGGRGVFPTLPPGVRPLPVDGRIARFEGDGGASLLGQVETRGWPDDSLWADWVVLDTTMTEVARGRSTLEASACDPVRRRVADFLEALPAGRYQIGMQVHDNGGRRGVYRDTVGLAEPADRLALSDVVVTCGTYQPPPLSGQEPVVRIEPNPASTVYGKDPLTAYFEMYHLQAGADGQSRFEYDVTVRSAERDPRVWLQRLLAPRPIIPSVATTRSDTQPGSLRRQFISVPIAELPAGRYRLEITVRDLNAGTEANAATLFTKKDAGSGL